MGVIVFLSVIYIIYKLLAEALEKPKPNGSYFDWDEYWCDVKNGISATDQLKKRERGKYNKIRKESDI